MGRANEEAGASAWVDALRTMHATGQGLGEDALRARLGEVLLPPGVAAPERLRGEPTTPASDRFALAFACYTALSGAPPFAGATPLALRLDLLRCRPAPLQVEADPALVAWIHAALSAQPDNRPPVPEGLPAPAAQAALVPPAPQPPPAPAAPPPPPAPPKPRIRRVAASSARYAPGAEVGRGALGRVIAAVDRRLGRTVAIKQLLRSDAAGRRRFLREAVLTARLQHPGIIPVYDARLSRDGEPFYAMRLVDGQTLQDAIQARPTVDERLSLLPALVTAADAVGYAHAQGVVHRDLKPTNILLGPYGETVVIDWGLARVTGRPEVSTEPGPTSDDATLTGAGAILGTPAWMSPEQARGEPVDARADVYALGAVLYTLLAGHAPFTGGSGAEVIQEVATTPPVDLGQLAPAVPADLLAVVRKAMRADPEARYPTASELSADLRRFQTGQLVAAHRYTRSDRLRRWVGRNRALVRLAVAALIALALLGSWSVARIVRAERVARARAEELALQTALATRDLDPDAARRALTQLGPAFPAWGAGRTVLADLAQRPGWLAWDGCRANDDPDGSDVGGAGVACLRDDGGWQVGLADGRVVASHTVERPVAIALSPDGRYVVVSGPRSAELWQIGEDGALSPGAPLPPPPGGRERALLVGWRADSAQLAVSWGGQALWVGPVDGPRRELAAPGVINLTWGGERLLVTAIDGQVSLLEPGASAPRPLLRTGGPSWRVAVDARGERAALAGTERLVRVIRLDTGAVLAAFPFGLGIANELSFDGDELLWVGTGEELERYDVRTGARSSWSAGLGGLSAVAASGDLLAVGAGSGEIAVWNHRTGERFRLAGHHGELLHLGFADDALVAVSGDGVARRWSLAEQAAFVAELAPLPVHDPHVLPTRAAFLADELVWIGVDGHLRRAPRADLRAAVRLEGAGGAWSLAGCPDGAVLWGEQDGSVWRAPPGGPAVVMHRLPAAARGVVCGEVAGAADAAGDVVLLRGAEPVLTTMAFPVVRLAEADGHLFAADHRGNLRQLGPEGAVELPALGDFPWTVTAGPAGLLTATAAGHWRVTRDGAVVAEGIDPGAWFARWRPDGELFALGRSSGDVLLREAATGAQRVLLDTTNHNTRALAWSPRGDVLAAAGDNGVVTLIDPTSGVTRALHGHGASVYGLSFSPDGDALLSVGDDLRLRLWRDDLPRDGAGLQRVAAGSE